jgi:serine/threonine-protein kinase
MPEFVERFEREARAAARIGSPHVCDVLDLGDLPNGDRYIVMEYLDGISFEDRIIERGKLTPAQLAPIAFELLEGLGTMHGARVIHRDLKPANIFLARTSGGRGEMVKILDFGVAKLLPFGGEVGTMTQTGTMMGTPLYMSPEQARGARDVDGRTDIYAASVMFYRALSGVLPYNAATLNELLFKIVLEDPKPLREVVPDVDEAFAAIIHKGLARDIDQRFQNARDYQAAIAAWGKAQGRSSLSFAVTVSSERPAPHTPVTLPEVPHAEPIVASAVTSPNSGTPIAWSEDAAKRDSGAPALASASGPSAAGANASKTLALASTPPGSAERSSQTLASPSDPSLSTGGNGNATTAPVPVADNAPAAAALGRSVGTTEPSVAGSRRKSSRGLWLGVAGAGAVAIVAVVGFSRATGDRPPPAGMSPVATESPSDSASAANGHAEKTSPPATARASVAATADGGTLAPPAEMITTTAVPDAHREAREPAPIRKSDAAAKPAAAPAVTPGASALIAAPAAASATAPSTPKPASSGRKFRTNLD